MDPRMNTPPSICSPTTIPSPPVAAATSSAAPGGAGSTGGGAVEEDGEEGEGRQARVVVCDINTAMLQVGRQRAQEQGACTRV